ncbi:MAG: FtsX-like permease family protein [Pseudomonadota bacterium]
MSTTDRRPVALRIAQRDLRGGLASARIFILCLALGVASIAGVGSVRQAIEVGMNREASIILGGDAELRFTYRYADEDERRFMAEIATAVSETVDFRSMAVVGDTRALTQVRGVDELWPLYGEAGTEPFVPPVEAFDARAEEPGALMDPILAERLDIVPGDRFVLGTQSFVLRALLIDEPDAGGSGFALGPRTVVPLWGLETSGLLAPGTLFETNYRLALPPDADLAQLEQTAEGRFPDRGIRWRDTRSPAPGVEEFVDRIGAFLILVGLAGLAVGGVGISASVRSYLEAKIATIATLRTLGAETRVIFAAYFLQILAMTAFGIALGLALGAALPVVLAPLIEARLPVPIDLAIYPRPLAEAALYGILAALIFTLWPLARTGHVRAASLYRQGIGLSGLPHWGYLMVLVLLTGALVGAAAFLSGSAFLALWVAAGVGMALAVLAVAGLILRSFARRVAPSIRNQPALRAALAAIGAPGSDAVSVVLSLGLGLWILATMGQVDANLRAAIARDLPQVAPSYFFVDIQRDQMPNFLERMDNEPTISRIDHAPLLRGVLTQINGRPAAEIAGEHWVLQGDRGLTYSAELPRDVGLVAGAWWSPDYDGPPLLSFAAEEAEEMGIGLGDEITVNVLGRDITAEIAALTDIDFSNAGIGFIMTFSPNALIGAPHTHMATIYIEEAAEAAILNDIGDAMPNVTAIRVRDAIDQVSDALRSLAAATSLGAAVTLLTGFVVLIGAAAAGDRARVKEAAVLKTLGATKAKILTSFALRSGFLGAAAGIIAVLAGALAGWAVLTQVMESSYRFAPVSAILIVAGGALLSLIAGLGFALRPLAVRPAPILRNQD